MSTPRPPQDGGDFLVELRCPLKGIAGFEYGKVTAVYQVQVAPDAHVTCYRVRFGIGPVRHFTECEFGRLFRSKDPRPRKRMRVCHG